MTKATALALLVAVTFFMENLDATVITTAIPQMAKEFSVSPVSLNIGISAYLLAVAIFIPISGWLADRFGARTIFTAAILIFTFASILCGLSQDLMLFTLSRILQGIGGALMVPVGRMVVLRVTEKKDMVKTIAFITWPGLIAPVIGPLLGGMIVSYGHWPWIFWLNIPLGIVAIIVTLYLMPQLKAEEKRPFDVKGFLLISSTCTLIIIAIECMGGLSMSLGILLLALGVLCSLLAWRHSLQHATPLLSLSMLRIPTFRSAVVGGSFFRASINAIPFLLPLLFQLSFGWSAAQAGSMVLWVFAGNLAMKPATTWLMFRFGFKRILFLNGMLSVFSILSCLFITPAQGYLLIAAILFIGGLSRSLQFSCYNSMGFADVPREKLSEASVIFSILFQFSMSFGIAISAMILRFSMQLAGQTSPSQQDIHIAFAAIAVLVVMSLVDVWRLEKNAGEKVLAR